MEDPSRKRQQPAEAEGKGASSSAVQLHASASCKDLPVLYTEEEARVVATARNEHQDTTAACRRCLKVANETTQVAAATLDALYTQGQQVQRAAHGVEQIDTNVKHASRIVRYMSRLCCFRNTWNDPDYERERYYRRDEVARQQNARVDAAEGIAQAYAAKRQFVGDAAARAADGVMAADYAAVTAVVAAGGDDGTPRSGLIPAVPPAGGQLGRLGEGLAPADRRALAAESAAQEAYLEEIGAAVDQLRAMGMAMADEMEEQAPQLEALHKRTEDADMGLKGLNRGASKLAGTAPRRRRASSAAGGGGAYVAGQAAATAAAAAAKM